MQLRRRFARNLQKARAHRELTQERLADLSGLAVRHLQKIEAGEVNLTLLSIAAIADALGCEPRDLLGRPEEFSIGKKRN